MQHRSALVEAATEAGVLFQICAKLLVAGPVTLDLAQKILRCRFHRNGGRATVHGNDFFDLMNEPGIDFSEFADFFGRQALCRLRLEANEYGRGAEWPVFRAEENPAFPQARARGYAVRESEFPFAELL